MPASLFSRPITAMSRKSPTPGILPFVYALQLSLAIQASGQSSVQDAAREFRTRLAGKVQLLEKDNAAAFAGADGWLFLSAELRFLSVARFWGAEAVNVSRSPKPEWADPIPAIVDFNKQLKDRGIQLLLVPVPPKAEIYPDKILPEVHVSGSEITPLMGLFYDELRSQGVDVLDLALSFLAYRTKEQEAVFCKTDTHWSGIGCMLAAQAIAEKIRAKVPELPSKGDYTTDWVNISIEGDLSGLLSAKIPKPGPENVRVRSVVSKATGSGIIPEPNSPVLLLGDSFTLVFHDFYATNAGLLDQLTAELGFAPDVIGTRGSGATPVRISLFRRGAKDPDFLAKKKIIVWCFAAREFTEAAQGWQKLPVGK
jgi:acetyltransferase AlgX (SGNH hydrolase-like protein)